MAKSILEIVFKVAREGTGDKDTQRELRALEKDFKGVMATMGLFAGAAAGVTAALKFAVNEAMDGEKELAKLNAVLKSTGGAAGLSQQALLGLANELHKLSGIDEGLIVNSEAVMMTFTQIGRQVFPEAMEAALNMNAVLGGDLQQSVIQLGKALNVTAGDTETASLGLTAMRRSGVSFTDAQKQMAMQMVKTGDVIGFQKMILEELNVEFGGAAKAMGDTTAGSSEKLKESIRTLGDAIGRQFLPTIKATNEALTETADTMTENIEAAESHGNAVREVAKTYGLTVDQVRQASAASKEFHEEFKLQVALYERNAAMAEVYRAQLAANTQATLESEEALKAQSDANKSMLSLIQSLQSEYTTFTEKNDALKLKLEELHVEQDKTSEWSSKYKKLQEEIDATTSEIDRLASEHEEASKRIAFSLLQQKLASDGLTDAEFNNLLKVGEQWGILDSTVVESAMVMNDNMGKMAEAMQEPFDSLKQINQQINQIKNKSGMAFDFFVNIHTSGSFPSFSGTVGGGTARPEMMAEGGRLAPVTIVGDAPGGRWTPYTEVIIGNRVFSNRDAKLMRDAGMLAGAVYRPLGGEIATDYGEIFYTGGGGGLGGNVTPGNIGNVYTGGGGGGGGGVPAPVVTSEITQASQMANVVVPLASATEEAVRTTQSLQQQNAMLMQTISFGIQSSTAGMISQQVETNRLLRENNSSLPRTLAAALQQVMP